MTRALVLAIVSLSFTPVWITLMIIKPEDIYMALATFIEVCSIGAFSLGASLVLDEILHPEAH